MKNLISYFSVQMRTLTLILPGLFNAFFMFAQTGNSPIGEYYLEGVKETASGFKLNDDNTFEFFFSQGALDRYGKGHYKISGDSILFTSDSIKMHVFSLVISKKQAGKTVTIKIEEAYKNLFPYIYVRIRSGSDVREAGIDSHGYFKYDRNKPDSIELAFEFCPEKITVFPVSSLDHNYFEFKIEPWLFEYFFNDFRLKWSHNNLSGFHPFLKGERFTYNKSTSGD